MHRTELAQTTKWNGTRGCGRWACLQVECTPPPSSRRKEAFGWRAGTEEEPRRKGEMMQELRWCSPCHHRCCSCAAAHHRYTKEYADGRRAAAKVVAQAESEGTRHLHHPSTTRRVLRCRQPDASLCVLRASHPLRAAACHVLDTCEHATPRIAIFASLRATQPNRCAGGQRAAAMGVPLVRCQRQCVRSVGVAPHRRCGAVRCPGERT
jgi:hypothetical protein